MLKQKGKVLFVGQSYYHTWYLSRELRKLGWKADVLNWDSSQENRKNMYHGEDFYFDYKSSKDLEYQYDFFLKAIHEYDIFHFSNAHGMTFSYYLHNKLKNTLGDFWDVKLLKKLGKKVVHSVSGCNDGVSKTSFGKWPGYESVCQSCAWLENDTVCNDEKNLEFAKNRNELADLIILNDGNKVDYNNSEKVKVIPEFYCLDENIWSKDLLIPTNYKLTYPKETIKIYHSISNYESRTDLKENKNIKSTHIYLKVIERLKQEGYPIELIFFKDISNKDIKYYQSQADIVVDMLTFGWYGANIRESMMLGKPCICFLRPEWEKIIEKDAPSHFSENPIISATPETIYEKLKFLIENKDYREEIGKKSREFALKWHSSKSAAKKFDTIYRSLLNK